MPRTFLLYSYVLLFIYSAFIIYASIVPLGHWAIPTKPIPYDFLYGWKNKIYLFDIYQNLLFYMPLGILIAFITKNKLPFILRLILCSSCALLLSTCLELIQGFHITRVSSLLDVILNTVSGFIGGILGCILTMQVFAYHRLSDKVFKTNQNKFLLFAATMLLFIGIAYHLYPYLPTLQYNHIKTGIKPLLVFWHNPDIFHFNHFIKYCIQGIGLYITGFILFKPNYRICLLLLLIVTILSLKVLIISRYASIESLGGLTSAVMLCSIFAYVLHNRFK